MRILAFPRDANPYQESLYREMRARGARVRYAGELTPSRTLNVLLLPAELAVGRLLGWRVLHVHWVWSFAVPVVGRLPVVRRLAQAWLGVVLGVARRAGVRVVWTAHNALPHEPVFHDDAAARRRLVDACDLVIVHADATIDALREIGATPRRWRRIPHGPLGPATAPGPRPGDGTTRLAFVGHLKPYKGVEDLLAAVHRIPVGERVEVEILGACEDPGLGHRLAELAGASPHPVRLRVGFAPDAELSAALARCDAMVAPFREVTTSGSVLLALRHGRPVVAPDVPALDDLPDGAVVRYRGGPEGLLGALLALIASGPGERAARCRSAAGHAPAGWGGIADATMAAITESGGTA